VVVLVSALRQGPSPSRVRVLHELFGVGERTLRRWRQWWQKIFVEGSFWRAARGRFMPAIAAQGLPRELVERFGAQGVDELCRLLRFLSAISTGSCVLSGGGF
jgi:cytochrome bd-type quinol oxidase subunit 2